MEGDLTWGEGSKLSQVRRNDWRRRKRGRENEQVKREIDKKREKKCKQ